MRPGRLHWLLASSIGATMIKGLLLNRSDRRLELSLIGLVTLVLLWALGTYWLKASVPMADLLSPGVTFESLYELLVQNQLTVHTLTSMKRVLVGLSLALVLGIPIGLAVGTSHALEN